MTRSDSSVPVPFVHLRVHSSYSLLEGALPVKSLARMCHDHRMPALALTDSGNLFGALEFASTMVEEGVQPIVGCVLKVDFNGDAPASEDLRINGAGNGHLPGVVLLAKDENGYRNLLALSSRAFLVHGGSVQPHVPMALLEERAAGLICLTGGPDGPIDQALLDGDGKIARARLDRLMSAFGDRLYVELQRHGMSGQAIVEPELIELAYLHALPLVATNNVHFGAAEDFEAHDALICISEGTVISEPDRRRLTPEHYFKAPSEMAALFADIPEAVDNTVEIARRCAYWPESRAPILPSYTANGGTVDDEAAELKRQAREGLQARLARDGPASGQTEEAYWQRLEYELDVIVGMQFPGYFLIVSDFIKWAKEQGIAVGPGRGSGAGSLVAYALLITDLDPLRFNLLFERFLNPERVSMPDFDIDFCQERRDEVIHYVQRKYGTEQVAQIITFGKLQARAVCRDVGRVLQMPYGQVDRLCKMIPNNPASPVTLSQAIRGEPRLQEARDQEPVVAKMLEIGQKLEGLYRHASTHAAGVVIGDRPLDELIPLYSDPRSDMQVTQFSMKWVEEAGLVKFDFLGLKTLTVLQKAVELIRAHADSDFDLGQIPYDDPRTYEMLAQGDTVGVFQLESSGFKDLLRKARPNCIEDIIALVALYRPGPMDNIPKYLAAKHGQEAPEFLHETVAPITADTYGVIIYQEQVMQIAQVLSGYTLGEADLLRRAMGKKIKSEMDQQKARFVRGAEERGVDKRQAEFIFELVAKFAGYGFNKSHSACYGVLAYQTAYLKANYPVAFLAASMTLDSGSTDKLNVFKREADRLGIPVEPPSINTSATDFRVESGHIRYSLAALKNVGRGVVEHIMTVRATGGPFTDIADFARRIDPRVVTRRSLESMACAGAFDGFDPNRARLLAGIDAIVSMAGRTAQDAESGQHELFSGSGAETGLVLPSVEPWLPLEQLAHELDAVGFYLSGHPLTDYTDTLARLGVESWAAFSEKVRTKGAPAGRLAGTVTYRQERRSKSGNRFAFVGFSDPTGQFEAVCFSDTLSASRDLLEPGNAVIIRVETGVEDGNGNDVRLRLQSVEPLESAVQDVSAGLIIFLREETALDGISMRLRERGRAPVRIIAQLPGSREVEIALGDHFAVTPQLRSAIKAIPGVVEVLEL